MMAMPKSVMKIKKDGVTFESKVDQASYTIDELSRRALYDTAKFIRKEMIKELKKMPGMKRSRRLYRSTQFWVRKWEKDLQIGYKHDSWYGAHQELGDRNQPARNTLRNAVYPNIDKIREIQGQYLSAIADENAAKALINEEEYLGNEDGEDD